MDLCGCLWTSLYAIITLKVCHIWIGAVWMMSDGIRWRSIVWQLHIIALMHRRHSIRIVAMHLQTINEKKIGKLNDLDRLICFVSVEYRTWLKRCWNVGLLCVFIPLLSKSAFSAYSVSAFHGGWYDVTSSPCKFNGESWRTGELATIGMPCIAP